MRKLKCLIGCLGLSALFSLSSIGQQSSEETFVLLGTSVTNIAASTTNTTGGTIFHKDQGNTPIRIWVKAEGNAATTNGVSAVSNLVVHISTASGSLGITNTFDTGLLSPIKVSVPKLGTSTNVASDWFELRGARYFRVGAIENNYLGSVSNVQVIVGYPK